MGILDAYLSSSEDEGPSQQFQSTLSLSRINKAVWCENLNPVSALQRRKKEKRKRARDDDPTSQSFAGPWAAYEGEAEAKQAWKDMQSRRDAEAPEFLSVSNSKSNNETKKDLASTTPPGAIQNYREGWSSASSYGDLIRSDNTVSLSSERGCGLPKKLVHTYEGHTAGVHRVRFHPLTAHLILSASMDGSCKIWEYYGERRCRGTYKHSKAVRDIQFTQEGRYFVSAGFDCIANLWNTETAQNLWQAKHDSLINCISVHPVNQNLIITGSKNKCAVQWDIRADPCKGPTQTYTGHMGAVNSVTFIKDGKQFFTTSDDKKILIYNFGKDVTQRYVADPTMQSMPAVTMHPSSDVFVAQSMDNKILSYDVGSFKVKKEYKGHVNSGYAIRPDFSSDGKFLVSGSSDGQVNFWDFKTAVLLKQLHAHEAVVADTQWHPFHSNRLVTASWDHSIKIWE